MDANRHQPQWIPNLKQHVLGCGVPFVDGRDSNLERVRQSRILRPRQLDGFFVPNLRFMNDVATRIKGEAHLELWPPNELTDLRNYYDHAQDADDRSYPRCPFDPHPHDVASCP